MGHVSLEVGPGMESTGETEARVVGGGEGGGLKQGCARCAR